MNFTLDPNAALIAFFMAFVLLGTWVTYYALLPIDAMPFKALRLAAFTTLSLPAAVILSVRAYGEARRGKSAVWAVVIPLTLPTLAISSLLETAEDFRDSENADRAIAELGALVGELG